jgi:hypothetical protein
VFGHVDQRRHRISGVQVHADVQVGAFLAYRRLGLGQRLSPIALQCIEEALGQGDAADTGERRGVDAVDQA